MKLNDKVKRPVFVPSKIDRNNKSFKRVVDSYEKWNGESDKREEYENDIILCLEHPHKDGFELTKLLESEVYLEGNTQLVEILDNVQDISRHATEELYKKWVHENFLTIPSDIIGKKVKYKQNYNNGSGYITTIKPETYQVCVSPDQNGNGGYVINYENVTFEENES